MDNDNPIMISYKSKTNKNIDTKGEMIYYASNSSSEERYKVKHNRNQRTMDLNNEDKSRERSRTLESRRRKEDFQIPVSSSFSSKSKNPINTSKPRSYSTSNSKSLGLGRADSELSSLKEKSKHSHRTDLTNSSNSTLTASTLNSVEKKQKRTMISGDTLRDKRNRGESDLNSEISNISNSTTEKEKQRERRKNYRRTLETSLDKQNYYRPLYNLTAPTERKKKKRKSLESIDFSSLNQKKDKQEDKFESNTKEGNMNGIVSSKNETYKEKMKIKRRSSSFRDSTNQTSFPSFPTSNVIKLTSNNKKDTTTSSSTKANKPSDYLYDADEPPPYAEVMWSRQNRSYIYETNVKDLTSNEPVGLEASARAATKPSPTQSIIILQDMPSSFGQTIGTGNVSMKQKKKSRHRNDSEDLPQYPYSSSAPSHSFHDKSLKKSKNEEEDEEEEDEDKLNRRSSTLSQYTILIEGEKSPLNYVNTFSKPSNNIPSTPPTLTTLPAPSTPWRHAGWLEIQSSFSGKWVGRYGVIDWQKSILRLFDTQITFEAPPNQEKILIHLSNSQLYSQVQQKKMIWNFFSRKSSKENEEKSLFLIREKKDYLFRCKIPEKSSWISAIRDAIASSK